jgi:hypothetical protein
MTARPSGAVTGAQRIVDQNVHRFVKGLVSLQIRLGDRDQLFRGG